MHHGCPNFLPSLPTASRDRKSTRLNSSHEWISYAVFCLKKKKNNKNSDNADDNNHNQQNVIKGSTKIHAEPAWSCCTQRMRSNDHSIASTCEHAEKDEIF